VPEAKRLQLRQCHSEPGDIVVAQLEDASTHFGIAIAADHYVQIDQVPIYLNRGGEGNVDDWIGAVFDVQIFQ
jgi:hypothetical protein